MKKIFIFLLSGLAVYLIINLYYLDRHYFLCPIEYKNDIIIRSDTRGDGSFYAGRNGRRVHEGVDFFAQIGTPVVAARSGRVALSRAIINKNIQTGSGNYIILKHPGNLITVYAHLLEVYVRKNNFVRQGQLIGRVGKTGNANYRDMQPHLHFEIRKNGMPQDPLDYLQ